MLKKCINNPKITAVKKNYSGDYMYYLLIGAILFFIILKFFSKKEKNTPEQNYDEEYIYDEKKYAEASENFENFEDNYFERINNGELSQQFLVLGGQQDCAIIQSLLAADNIPSYVENENINRMYGGVPSAVTGVFAIKLYILVNDYEKAYDIVCEYARSKKEEIVQNNDEIQSIAKTSATIITGLFFAPYPVNNEQKGLGITILPKKVQE